VVSFVTLLLYLRGSNTMYILNGPQCCSGYSGEEISLPLPGIEPRTVHFVALLLW
jgi:hypothetical protein